MKTVIVLLLGLVIAALAGAGVFMLRRRSEAGAEQRQMARALAWRVGLSVALFVLVLAAWSLGWIQPSGLPLGR